MKPITHEWLMRVTEDLAAAQMLLFRPDLTNVVAFHAQQAVEKALKMGFLPTGKPSSDEAADLFSFANDIVQRLQTGLQDAANTADADPGEG